MQCSPLSLLQALTQQTHAAAHAGPQGGIPQACKSVHAGRPMPCILKQEPVASGARGVVWWGHSARHPRARPCSTRLKALTPVCGQQTADRIASRSRQWPAIKLVTEAPCIAGLSDNSRSTYLSCNPTRSLYHPAPPETSASHSPALAQTYKLLV